MQLRAVSASLFTLARPVFYTVLAALAGTIAFSQTANTLSGTIKDPQGAVVASATVTIAGTNLPSPRATTTNEAGMYTVSGLAAGSYSVEVLSPGFEKFQQQVTIGAGQSPTFDISLQLAQAAAQVAVEGKIDPYNVVPTDPTPSVFGLNQKLEEIPRSVSLADAETLLRYDVKTVNDIVAVAPGTFTGSYFGIPGSVFIRGDVGDNFFRGFRRVENRGNYQTPVSASDHIEIVNGPPSPIYGGGRIGGFMNFVPKSVRSESAKWLERVTGKVTLTYGSYGEKMGSVEVGVPFMIRSHRSGFYAYFQDEDSHSFYKGVANRYQMGQIASDTELSSKWRIEYGFQGYHNTGTQNLGWNRVTQDLVDNHEYLAGSPLVNLSQNGYNIGPGDIPPGTLDTFAFQQNMAGPFLSNPSIANLYALNPATVHLVKLPLDTILIDAGDFSSAMTKTGYFDVNYDISSAIHFKNQSFYDGLDSLKFSSYGFGAGYRPWTVENKTTVSFDLHPTKWMTIHSIGGGGYRRVQVSAGEERNDYQTVDRRDISVGATPNDRFAGPFNSNSLIPYQYYQTGSYGDPGLFWLSDVLLGSRLSVTAGVRFDHYTPNFWGRDAGETDTHAVASANAGTYNASVAYQLPFHLRPYFTVATSRYLDLGQGNELDYSEILNGAYIQGSSLYEGGVKTSGLNQRIYVSFDYFRQKRATFNSLTNAPDYFLVNGAETQARAFILKRVSITAALTWQNPVQRNVPFLLGIPPDLLGLTPEQAYGGRFIGVASIFGQKPPFQVGGQPHWVGSPFGTVNITKNLGFTAGASFVSSVKAGYVSSVRLPSYVLTRGSVFYQRGKNLINLSTNNPFNEVYFQSQYLFWDVLIKPGALRTASLTYSYTF